MSDLHDLINAIDGCVDTVRRLAELGLLLDGNEDHFPHCIEVLYLISREAGHLEKLSGQLATTVLSGVSHFEALERD